MTAWLQGLLLAVQFAAFAVCVTMSIQVLRADKTPRLRAMRKQRMVAQSIAAIVAAASYGAEWAFGWYPHGWMWAIGWAVASGICFACWRRQVRTDSAEEASDANG